MTTYVVMAPPDFEGVSRDPRSADRLLFVPDSFSIAAFLFSFLWLLFHRMWLVFLAYVAVTLAVELAAQGLGPEAAVIAALAVSLLFALEAQALRRWSLERKGWRMVGVAEGDSQEEAETRFFFGLRATMNNERATRPSPSRPAATIVPRIGAEQVIGLTLGPETRK